MQLDVMLCDHAQLAEGKLFIAGANINQMGIPAGAPAPYLLNFAAAGLVTVPWTATNVEHSLRFRLLTEDGTNPPMPEGTTEDGSISGEMRFNVGRPPGITHGVDQQVPFAFNFQGLPVSALGTYVLDFEIDGSQERRLTFIVSMIQQAGYLPGQMR